MTNQNDAIIFVLSALDKNIFTQFIQKGYLDIFEELTQIKNVNYECFNNLNYKTPPEYTLKLEREAYDSQLELLSNTKLSMKHWVEFALDCSKVYKNYYKFIKNPPFGHFLQRLIVAIGGNFTFKGAERFLSFDDAKLLIMSAKHSLCKAKNLIGYLYISKVSYNEIKRELDDINNIWPLPSTSLYRTFLYDYDELVDALGYSNDDAFDLFVSLNSNYDIKHVFPRIYSFEFDFKDGNPNKPIMFQPFLFDKEYFINDVYVGFNLFNFYDSVRTAKNNKFLKSLVLDLDMINSIDKVADLLLNRIVDFGTLEKSSFMCLQFLNIIYRLKLKEKDFKDKNSLQRCKEFITKVVFNRAITEAYRGVTEYLIKNNFILYELVPEYFEISEYKVPTDFLEGSVEYKINIINKSIDALKDHTYFNLKDLIHLYYDYERND